MSTATTAKTVVTLAAEDNLYDKIMGEEGSIAMVENSGYFVNGHMADISMRAKLRGLKNATAIRCSKVTCRAALHILWMAAL